MAALQRAKHLHAVCAGHFEIEDHKMGWALMKGSKRSGHVCARHYVVTLSLKHLLTRVTHWFLVIHHKNPDAF